MDELHESSDEIASENWKTNLPVDIIASVPVVSTKLHLFRGSQ